MMDIISMKVRLYGITKPVNRPIVKATEKKTIITNKFQKGSRELRTF